MTDYEDVELVLGQDELLRLCLAAHEEGITLNEFVVNAAVAYAKECFARDEKGLPPNG